MDYNRTDALLAEAYKEANSITALLDAVFGFLKRNTDFYHIKTHADDKVGFSEGIREKIVQVCMERHAPGSPFNAMVSENDVPDAVQEVVVQSEDMEEYVPISDNTEEKLNIFENDDFKNGACMGNYCWSQTLKDLEIHVLLPVEVKCGKDVKVEVKNDSLRISTITDPNTYILSGRLSGKIKHNDVVWTMDNNMLHIHIDKTKGFWWERCFNTEPGIDPTMIEYEQYFDELPETSQAAISQLRAEQWEANEKEKSAVSLANMDKLQSSWNANGSSVKGQAYDSDFLGFP